MLPSKKIFVGASAIITGALLQVLLTYVLTSAITTAAAGISGSDGSSSAAEVDRRLEYLHSQIGLGFNPMTLSLVFILCGTALLLVGVYQSAKSVEWLLAAQAQRPDA